MDFVWIINETSLTTKWIGGLLLVLAIITAVIDIYYEGSVKKTKDLLRTLLVGIHGIIALFSIFFLPYAYHVDEVKSVLLLFRFQSKVFCFIPVNIDFEFILKINSLLYILLTLIFFTAVFYVIGIKVVHDNSLFLTYFLYLEIALIIFFCSWDGFTSVTVFQLCIITILGHLIWPWGCWNVSFKKGDSIFWVFQAYYTVSSLSHVWLLAFLIYMQLYQTGLSHEDYLNVKGLQSFFFLFLLVGLVIFAHEDDYKERLPIIISEPHYIMSVTVGFPILLLIVILLFSYCIIGPVLGPILGTIPDSWEQFAFLLVSLSFAFCFSLFFLVNSKNFDDRRPIRIGWIIFFTFVILILYIQGFMSLSVSLILLELLIYLWLISNVLLKK